MNNAFKLLAMAVAGLAAFILASPQASAASAGTLPMSMKGVIADTALGSFVEEAQYRRRNRIRRLCRRRWGGGF
jgi:hypothetical protein